MTNGIKKHLEVTMSIEKEFIPYNEALALKQLGFNEPCFGFWNYNDSKMYYWNDEEIQNERTNKWFLDTEKKFPKISKNGCTAPTFSQAFRWFRDEYNLDYDISKNEKSMIDYVASKGVKNLLKYRYGYTKDSYQNIGATMSYEEAELACLRKLIEIVQGGNK